MVVGIDLEEMIEYYEQHGGDSEKYGQGVELGVGDHGGGLRGELAEGSWSCDDASWRDYVCLSVFFALDNSDPKSSMRAVGCCLRSEERRVGKECRN